MSTRLINTITIACVLTYYNDILYNVLYKSDWHVQVVVCSQTSKVYRVAWWMSHYSAPTPKRHYAFSNSGAIARLDRGRLHLATHQAQRKEKVVTAKRSRNAAGKITYQGTDALRQTEQLARMESSSDTCIYKFKAKNLLYIQIRYKFDTPDLPVTKLKPSWRPREYPMQFGRHLANNCEALKAACESKPLIPSDIGQATEIFESMQYGVKPELWAFADLKSVFKYLRGGKSLNLPHEWKHLVPRSWPEGPVSS